MNWFILRKLGYDNLNVIENLIIYKDFKVNQSNMMYYLAYIDPGSGSLLFQALISGLLTILVFYKRVIAYIKQLFSKKK